MKLERRLERRKERNKLTPQIDTLETLSASTQELAANESAELLSSDGDAGNWSVQSGRRPSKHWQIAYSLWQARGCPIGNPEEDWYRAGQLAQDEDWTACTARETNG